MAFDLKVGYM